MTPLYARLNASTKRDRHESMALVRESFANENGWILDVHLFSNISANFNFEIDLAHLFKVVAILEEAGVRFTSRSHRFLEEHRPMACEGSQPTECTGTLQVTFIHNDPDLRRVIPAVPG